ncbi:hypothetical protein JCM10450v2_000798 [Rhodotorula kratochvilovae]
MPTSRSAPVNALTDSDASSSDSEHSPRSLEACAASFYDDASALHHALDALSSVFLSLRALSARLSALHPNDLATPTLALDLRDALLDAAKRLRAVDEGAFELWEGEERVRLACERGMFELGEANTAAVGDQEGELAERRDEVDGVVRRLGRRVKEVRREARGEAKDRRRSARRNGGGNEEPEKVGDYFEEGVYEFPHMLTKDTVHASRWVVENPFTILARLVDDPKALRIPQLKKASGKESWTHRLFDELAVDGKEGVREIRVATERGHRERWVVFLLVALFPILLIANLVEDFFLSRRSPSPSASSSTTGSFSLRSLAPTMLAEQKRAVVTGMTGWTGEERELRERRRRSAEFEGALV